MTTAIRRTQAERSADTRERLLSATMECLYEHGYGDLTTRVVETRAGVSRGALLHHYASKSDLLVAAVDYMARRWEAGMLVDAQLQQERGIAGLLQLLWRHLDAPVAYATMEIWMASRTDPLLREALKAQEGRLQAHLPEVVAPFLSVDVDDPAFTTGLQLCWQFLRGAAVTSILARDDKEQERLLREFATSVGPYFRGAPPPSATGSASSSASRPSRVVERAEPA